MHGKIVQYSHDTGIGIIINASKKLFDFKLQNWHDNTKIPEIDLLVEFRLEDENHNVIDVRSSKYQKFGEDSIVKERDFWKTNSDDELEKLESNVFDELVMETYKKTDYMIISHIQTSISIDKFIQYHFENETQIIKIAYKFPIDGYEKLDYRIVSRFLKRTLDSLIYTDKRITRDTFSVYLQVFSKLQYFMTAFYKAQQDSKKVFEEYFLPHQLYLNAANRKLLNLKDDILRLETRKRNIKSEIYAINIKLTNTGIKNEQILKEKIIKLDSQHKECTKNIEVLKKIQERVANLITLFIKTYEKDFLIRFDKVKEQIFEHIKNALNITITSLDNKMWQLGMRSEPIKNHFFKLQSSYSFCTLAFIQQYIKTLDKNKLSDNDKLLSMYINKYTEKNTKRILIVSNRIEFEMKLKIDILREYKDFLVTQINKKMEYLIIITNQKFDFVIIDNNMKEDKPIEMIVQGKSTKLNKDSTFILVQSESK
ncbi:hypothetical protein CCY99_03345 [Helicobacter sp. 16-1353]|uniref:hypothetical protein n=1 Tax=Helicobacter sp. 16-1353 TaxID=2004996 RepID=UPI000DCC8411|nr:hypothetical protein [Helicobacter sp. 16-1353]RAX54401.1 hypothetical protein CCY99_03345 [Helicobacter sp. 16-1353]